MIKSERFNNLPEKILKKIPELKPGQTVHFQLVGLKPDPNNPGTILCPASKDFPVTDLITVGSESYEIALITGWRTGAKGQEPNLENIWFRKESGGIIALNGSNAKDRLIYEYMMLSNSRADNDLIVEDESREKIFELVDRKGDAQKERSAREKRFQAQKIAYELTPAEVKDFALAMGANENLSDDELRNILEKLAVDKPDDFMALAMDKSTNVIKANIQRAFNKNVIVFDRPTKEVRWGSTGEMITTVPPNRTSEYQASFFSFVNKNEKGKEIYDQICTLLK